MKFHFVSLGCAKNLVDSELMIGRLIQAGWTHTDVPAKADMIIVNTCSFIETAVNESIDTILELAQYKHEGSCQRLIVSGCLPERFREEIVKEFPEVDFFMGTGAFDKIVAAANGSIKDTACFLPDPNQTSLWDPETPRIRTSHYLAYLKIAEGCDRRCTYCIIPKLRGKQRSRRPANIVDEAQGLIKSGVKEIVLIAQDTTYYGTDLHPPVSLEQVIEEISGISDKIWIRILYGHPESINDSVIRTIAEHGNICNYFDIPIQHASDRILKKMGRNYSSDDLRRLFDTIRSSVSDAALRTSVIVGFPGETDKDFDALLTFINETGFDNLGVFIYSDAEDLPSHRVAGHIPEHEAMRRYDRVMACQQEISSVNNQKYLGNIYDVLVEEETDNHLYKGRTFFQAPEVDGTTVIHSKPLEIGAFVRVRIDKAFEYDLEGKTV